MAITIKSPNKSFVQNSCNCEVLQILDESDLKFSLIVQAETDEEIQKVGSQPLSSFSLKVLSECNSCSPQQIYNNEIFDYVSSNTFFKRYRINNNQFLFYWEHGLPNIHSLVEINKIFQLAISFTFGNTTIDQPLNCFVRTSDAQFTTAIEYMCKENSNGFYYCLDELPNKVRLPFYISKPQFIDEEEVYINSDGNAQLLSSITKKELELKTDYLSEEQHEKLKIALSSDYVFCSSLNYEGEVRKSSNYEIEWLESNDINEAPAKCKVLTTPYNVNNDNCEECSTWNCQSCEFEVFTLPDAQVNVAYLFETNLIGSIPFYLGTCNLPAWMNISINGRTLKLSGTPTNAIADILIELNIENCDRSINIAHYDQLIDVNP